MPRLKFDEQVRLAIEREGLFPKRGIIIVACSGGADSMALLLALHEICGSEKAPFPEVRLHVAHLDHGLRGEMGASDAQFVREQAIAMGLAVTLGNIDADEHARWSGSLEASARMARYRFLREVAAQTGAECIATGHTADDQTETILWHFIRGASLEGLTGMRPRAGDLIRPLLELRRAETEARCAIADITPREDATNADLHFTRNRIRAELLPLLETYQPQIRATVNRNAQIIAQDNDYIDAEAERHWLALITSESTGQITLSRLTLRSLHPALRARTLRRAITAVGSAKSDAHLDADTIRRLDRVVMDGSGAKRIVQCSTGAEAICDRDTVAIKRREAAGEA